MYPLNFNIDTQNRRTCARKYLLNNIDLHLVEFDGICTVNIPIPWILWVWVSSHLDQISHPISSRGFRSQVSVMWLRCFPNTWEVLGSYNHHCTNPGLSKGGYWKDGLFCSFLDSANGLVWGSVVS